MAVRVLSHKFCSDANYHSSKISEEIEHQESPSRLKAILGALQASYGDKLVEYTNFDNEEDEAARLLRVCEKTVSLVHSSEYLEKLKLICDGLEEFSSEPLSPRLIHDLNRTGGATIASKRSYVTALAAVDTCVRAVDICSEATTPIRVLCLVRPPGHHAGPSFPDKRVGGCGFCLLNSAAIAAAVGRQTFERIAIVDLDVHHGNGTEACVRSLKKGVFYGSIHLCEVFEDNPDADFFPGTGLKSENQDDGTTIVNCPLTPLWVAGYRKKRAKQVKGRKAFFDALETVMVPALRRFDPQLLIISSGFDGAKGDEGNLSEDGLVSGLDLTPNDFRKVTSILSSLCPRVISILEGGYGCFQQDTGRFDRTLLVNCCLEHIKGLQESK